MVVPPTSSPNAAAEGRAYETRHIEFRGSNRRIVLQEGDGPCSLIAICNWLILLGFKELPDRSAFSEDELLNWVAELIIALYGHTKEIMDTIELLRRFATGLHVDIKFRRIDDFGHTPQLKIFRQLHIPLYHGCIVDPKDHYTASAIGSKSYDKLEDELVYDLRARNMTPQKRNLFQKFVNNKSSPTTYGLSCLQHDVEGGQLCVLFHNEHFSTMFKYEGELYLLASNKAFLNDPDCVWKKLTEVKGGNVYMSSNFKECKMDYYGSINSAALAGPDTSGDELFARHLQQQLESENADLWSPGG